MRNRTADLLITNQLLYQLSYVGLIYYVTGDLLKDRATVHRLSPLWRDL